MVHIVVQADDLSGAAETAHCFVRHGLRTRLVLDDRDADTAPSPAGWSAAAGPVDVLVHDTHSRGLPEAEAEELVAEVFRGALDDPDHLAFKKVDSLWRGNVCAEIAAITQVGHHVVIAGALPELHRTVVEGRPLVAGVPLAATEYWQAETRQPPTDLPLLLRPHAPDQVRRLGLADLRGKDCPSILAELLRGPVPTVVVVDGETAEDLALLVDALVEVDFKGAGRRVVLAGSGATAAALADRYARPAAQSAQSSEESRAPQPPEELRARPVLAVVGSASARALAQVGRLESHGFLLVRVDPTEPTDPGAPLPQLEECRTALATGRDVAVITAETQVDPGRSAEIVAALTHFAVRSSAGRPPPDLLLTGGETAREVLTALGHHALTPLRTAQHGAVLSRTDSGTLVGTKPGSFGDDLALVELHDLLRLTAADDPRTIDPRTFPVLTLEQ